MNGYEYETETDTTNAHGAVTTRELNLVGRTKHDIFNIPK